MTRPAIIKRKAAFTLVGGSFLLLASAATVARADDAVSEKTATEVVNGPVATGGARLNITPLRVEFEAGKNTATLTLTNTSERTVPVQTRLFAWSQQNGEDVYAPSTALTVSPAIIAIPSGATQIIRLLRTDPPSPGEKPFRLAVDQLPDPASLETGTAEARIRFTLPVFFDRDKAAPAAISWKLDGEGLKALNTGGSTARILSLEVTDAAGRTVQAGRNSMRYVHGGSAVTWPIANSCTLGAVKITAQVDGQTVNGTASPTCG